MTSLARGQLPRDHDDLVRLFLRWSFARGLCARGYWLAASVYLVVVADLSPSQLVLLGTGQAVTVLLAEVPAGVFADTVSRKWSVVLAHLISGIGMAVTGVVIAFPLLVVTQALWGLGWAFASGADVAWITDELDRPGLIDRVLAARARWELVGAATGLVAFAVVAAITSLGTAVVLSGVAFVGLGAVVALRFPERRFTPAPVEQRWRDAMSIFRRGVRLARRDRVVVFVIVAWLLVNGGSEGFGRLVEKRLVTLGFGDSGRGIVWFAALGLVTLLASAVVLRVVESRIHQAAVARRTYVLCCLVGVVGLVLFAHAPDSRYAVAAVLLAKNVEVVRTVGEIWVNRRTTSDVRATVHSLLSQSEHLGELVFGLLLAAVAAASTVTVSLTGSAILLALAAAVVSAAESRRPLRARRWPSPHRSP